MIKDILTHGTIWSSRPIICLGVIFQIKCYHASCSGALCNIRYPSEIHLKLKSRKISFAHNSCFSWPIAFKFCTVHGSITTVLCATFQTDWTIETDVMDERDFARFAKVGSLRSQWSDGHKHRLAVAYASPLRKHEHPFVLASPRLNFNSYYA